MMGSIFSLLLIFLSLTFAFQGGISEFFRNNEDTIYKNIDLISHFGKDKKSIKKQREILGKDEEAEDSSLNKDFIIDEEELIAPKGDLKNSYSLMNFREKKGELYIPCFGMWWPSGGGQVTYEYTEDDYGGGEKRKKRRRAKKQKRTSKAKKKKRT